MLAARAGGWWWCWRLGRGGWRRRGDGSSQMRAAVSLAAPERQETAPHPDDGATAHPSGAAPPPVHCDLPVTTSDAGKPTTVPASMRTHCHWSWMSSESGSREAK